MGRLPTGTTLSVKVQLRKDVERALAHHSPSDDEAEIRDVVAGVVEDALSGLETKAAELLKEANKAAVIARASVLLLAALAKHDRGLVAAMLKKPESSFETLTARLKRFLARHLKGNEDVAETQFLADTWVGRRLDKQPPVRGGISGSALAAAGVVAATAGISAYQNPAVKAAVNQGLTRARQLIQRWKSAPPSTSESAPRGSQ